MMEGLFLVPLPILLAMGSLLIITCSPLFPDRIRKWRMVILILSFCFISYAIGQRWHEAGRAPLQTLYETLVFFSWCLIVAYLAFRFLFRIDFFMPLASLFALFVLGYAVTCLDSEVLHLPPALQSNWFIPHVASYFIAYGMLALAALGAGVCLIISKVSSSSAHKTEKPSPDIQQLRAFSYAATSIGFCFLTLGLITGAVWGKIAWGDYWTWDPKESWALMSWLMYLAVLHAFYSPRLKEKWCLSINILAFGVVMFTYLGMHLLPTAGDSVHVYGNQTASTVVDGGG